MALASSSDDAPLAIQRGAVLAVNSRLIREFTVESDVELYPKANDRGQR